MKVRKLNFKAEKNVIKGITNVTCEFRPRKLKNIKKPTI